MTSDRVFTDHFAADARVAPPPLRIADISNPDEFRQRAEALQEEIDSNRNGFLSRQEIAAADQNHRYAGGDAQVIAGLLYNEAFKGLANTADDQKGEETEISMRDIGRISGEIQTEVEQSKAMVDWTTEETFDWMDKNHNGFLQYSEIEEKLELPWLDTASKGALTKMKTSYDTVQRSSNDEWFIDNSGITRKDLAAYAKRFPYLKSMYDSMDFALYGAKLTRESAQNNKLFASETVRESIGPDGVMQGNISDCYFVAALASVSQTNPASIHKMIKDNKNGTYTVTFPGDREHPVTVAAPTEAQLGLYAKATENGTWANVLERAFGQWRIEQRNSRVKNPINAYDATNGPETAAFALHLLTGQKPESQRIDSLTDGQLVSSLDSSLNRKTPRALTAMIPAKAGETLTASGLHRDHVYSILSFERDSRNDGIITLRNPWGYSYGLEGTFSMNVEEFRRNFDSYTVA